MPERVRRVQKLYIRASVDRLRGLRLGDAKHVTEERGVFGQQALVDAEAEHMLGAVIGSENDTAILKPELFVAYEDRTSRREWLRMGPVEGYVRLGLLIFIHGPRSFCSRFVLHMRCRTGVGICRKISDGKPKGQN